MHWVVGSFRYHKSIMPCSMVSFSHYALLLFLFVFSVKVPRIAAFELATMAAASDDNKFRIVAEGG